MSKKKTSGELRLSRCSKCRSTERTEYSNTIRRPLKGQNADGPYNTVVWRTTSCKKCGQRRVDKSFELRVEKEKPKNADPA